MVKIKEDEFIVINKKHLRHLAETKAGQVFIINLINALNSFCGAYKMKADKDLTLNKYYVCNKDEPYAQKVLEVILEGEMKKEELKNENIKTIIPRTK